MLTYQDCLGMCDFSKDEIKLIASHEHISGMAAIGLAENLLHRRDGRKEIERLIKSELERVQCLGDAEEVARVRRMLDHYLEPGD